MSLNKLCIISNYNPAYLNKTPELHKNKLLVSVKEYLNKNGTELIIPYFGKNFNAYNRTIFNYIKYNNLNFVTKVPIKDKKQTLLNVEDNIIYLCDKVDYFLFIEFPVIFNYQDFKRALFTAKEFKYGFVIKIEVEKNFKSFKTIYM